MAHTPGPWKVGSYYFGRDQGNRSITVVRATVEGPEYTDRFGTHKTAIAQLADIEAEHSADGDIMYYGPSKRAQADAALMAAAPEMREENERLHWQVKAQAKTIDDLQAKAGEQLAELQRLEADRNTWRNVYSEEYVNELSAIGSKYMEKCDELRREIGRLTNQGEERAAEIARLFEALCVYGTHQPGCMSHRHNPDEPEPECDCGLHEALDNSNVPPQS